MGIRKYRKRGEGGTKRSPRRRPRKKAYKTTKKKKNGIKKPQGNEKEEVKKA